MTGSKGGRCHHSAQHQLRWLFWLHGLVSSAKPDSKAPMQRTHPLASAPGSVLGASQTQAGTLRNSRMSLLPTDAGQPWTLLEVRKPD